MIGRSPVLAVVLAAGCARTGGPSPAAVRSNAMPAPAGDAGASVRDDPMRADSVAEGYSGHCGGTPRSSPDVRPLCPRGADSASGRGCVAEGGYDRQAAADALARIAASVQSCRTADGPTGPGRVCVVFGSTGAVTQAQVQGVPFEGTPTGDCIASKFRVARVPPFTGGWVEAIKTFRIE